jgi:hypothetical protein
VDARKLLLKELRAADKAEHEAYTEFWLCTAEELIASGGEYHHSNNEGLNNIQREIESRWCRQHVRPHLEEWGKRIDHSVFLDPASEDERAALGAECAAAEDGASEEEGAAGGVEDTAGGDHESSNGGSDNSSGHSGSYLDSDFDGSGDEL